VFEPRDLELCSRLNLWHTVHCDAQIDWLAMHKTHAPHRVFLKMNSGMNRLGFTPERFRAAHARLSALPQVDEIALMTHFADADDARDITAQWAVFERVTDGLPGERSVCNSAATLRHGHEAAVRADWVRPGIAAYGGSPDHPVHSAEHWGLQPAMSLNARLLAVQQLPPATPWATAPASPPPRPCASAPWPAATPTATRATPAPARRCWWTACAPALGRVSMDMLAVDLSPVPQAGPGSEVTLWGRSSHGAVLPIDEVAQSAGTIGYELMCALALRVPVTVTVD
jgi:alanine racemase